MSHFVRRLAALLAGVLVILLASCGDVTPKEAQAYIQGELDACYLGQYNQDYLDLLGISAAAAEAQHYVWNTQAEAEFLMDYLDIYPTEASYEQAVDLVRDIYACSKYQVGTASKLEDGSYAVTVSVQPMDILIRYQNQTDVNEVWLAVLAEHGVTASARCCLKWAMGPSSRWCCSCSWRTTPTPWWGPTCSIWTA